MEEAGRRPVAGSGNVAVKPDEKDDVDESPDDSSDVPGTVMYVTALDYPEGYDWRTDPEKGSVRCSLVVYADGDQVLKVPVGDSYEVSSDPDMHRMCNGHLYTDYSTESETVIKRDGNEIIRYRGREMICGLLEEGGDVYTLGHSRTGDGFSFRKNGEIMLSREKGSSFGRLDLQDDGISFFFREPDGQSENYCHVVNGDIFRVTLHEDVRTVWDMVFHKDEICILANVHGMFVPVLFNCGKRQNLSLLEMSMILTCRIIPGDDALYVEGLCRRLGKPVSSGLWSGDGGLVLFPEGNTVSSFCTGEGGLCCTVNPSVPSSCGTVYRCGDTYPMPPDYATLSDNALLLTPDGCLHAGLSSLTGAPPLLWQDGETTPLEINGFITGITTNNK